jgi:hypothetical protein
VPTEVGGCGDCSRARWSCPGIVGVSSQLTSSSISLIHFDTIWLKCVFLVFFTQSAASASSEPEAHHRQKRQPLMKVHRMSVYSSSRGSSGSYHTGPLFDGAKCRGFTRKKPLKLKNCTALRHDGATIWVCLLDPETPVWLDSRLLEVKVRKGFSLHVGMAGSSRKTTTIGGSVAPIQFISTCRQLLLLPPVSIAFACVLVIIMHHGYSYFCCGLTGERPRYMAFSLLFGFSCLQMLLLSPMYIRHLFFFLRFVWNFIAHILRTS